MITKKSYSNHRNQTACTLLSDIRQEDRPADAGVDSYGKRFAIQLRSVGEKRSLTETPGDVEEASGTQINA